MRILLVDPASRSGIVEPYEHLGLGYLCAVLRKKGYRVDMLSAPLQNISSRRLVKEIKKLEPTLVGFSVKEIGARRTLRLIQDLRYSGLQSHITLGGHFPTFNHKRILQDFPEVDSIVRGEGEDTLVELVEALVKGRSLSDIHGLTYRDWHHIRINPPRPLIVELDRLPFPARDMTQDVVEQGGAIEISASRGCYANCSFCSIRSFYSTSPGRKWRARSPKRVVDEIESLTSRFPHTPFKFTDDQFIGPGEKGRLYTLDIASEIEKRSLSIEFIISCRVDAIEEELFSTLKEAGLIKVFLGIESGLQQGLDRFNKKTTVEQNKRALEILKKIGLDYTIAFIFFDPYTTFEEIKGNLNFLADIRPYWQGKKGVLSVEPSIIVHKGTPIEQKLKKEGRLHGNYMGYGYRIEDPKVQIIRAMADFFIRGILPTYFELKLKRKAISGRIKQKFASMVSY